jgi:hypothetical protein
LLAGLTGCSGDLFLKGDSANSSMKAKPAVALAPAQGVPQKYASKVNDQFATLIKANGVAIVDAKDAVYVVKPTYVAQAEGKHGTKVAYTIDVMDKAGNKVRTITGEENVSPKHGGDSWHHVTEEAVQKVAMKSATDVSAWIENPNAPVPAPAVAEAKPEDAAPAKAAAAKTASAPVKTAANTSPKASRTKAPAETASLASAVDTSAPAAPVQTASAAPHEIVAVVPAVSGAPGDGKTSLSDAMKKALSRQGVKLSSAGGAGTYKIQGQVELGAVANGQQPITIRWVVIDPTGKQMEKTVVQNNRINAGSLDGAWGEVAEQAAGAAASEVSKLLNKGSGQAQAGSGSAG